MDNRNLRERVEQVVQETKTDFARREKAMRKLLKEAERSEDFYCVGLINLQLSMCYFELGHRVDILPHACKAVGIFENSDEYALLSRSYNLLGIAYTAQENFQQALASYNKALDTIRGHRSKNLLKREAVLNNIAESYYQMGEYQKSFRILSSCLSSCKRKTPDNHVSIVIYGINLSDLYESMEEYKKSIEILDLIQPDVEKLPTATLVYGYYARRACAFYKAGDNETGTYYADLALEGCRDARDTYEFHRDFERIAALEVQLGDYARAQSFADILTNYADASDHTLDQIIAKRVQATICDSRGEKARALLLYKDLNDLYERRVNEQNAMQYESQKNAEAASREISKLMKKIRISEEKAERDPLSGLMNRAALINVSSTFLEKAKEKGKRLGGIFFDIDFFKEFNDTYGHAAGDDAIRCVSRACLSEENANIKFFRYGGDEFFGVVLGCKDEELEGLALKISEKIHASGVEHIKNPNGQRLTVSVGVANLNPKDADYTILDIVKYADKALYRAKDAGKDTVFAFRVSEDEEHEYKQIKAE